MKIYIDMDGTLTSYNYADYDNNYWKVHPEVLCKEPVIKHIPSDWIILTKTATPREASLKKAWAHLHYPDNVIITLAPAESKALYASNDSILLDDNNDNLREWEQAGGIPVKIINNVNILSKDKVPHMKSIPQQPNFHTELVVQDDHSLAVCFLTKTKRRESCHKLYLGGKYNA